MRLIIQDPVRILLPEGLDERLLQSHLKFRDHKVDFELKRLKSGASWHVQRMGQEAFQERYEQLLEMREQTLIFNDIDNRRWTYAGLAQYLESKFPDLLPSERAFELPVPTAIPWIKTPPASRPYQNDAHSALLAQGHAAVEMGTGLGKSHIIMKLSRDIGRKTIIMAPSVSIAGQLYEDHLSHLGPRYVGAYFDKRKKSDKLLTVATAQSLTRIVPGTQAWWDLSAAEVLIADESHMTPADTLSKVCLGQWQRREGNPGENWFHWVPGLAAKAPWRFFFSGTQIRNDGLDLLLRGIIGPTVYSMTVREGVEKGFLARPRFHMVNLASRSLYDKSDANAMTRVHLYENPAVGEAAGAMATKFAAAGHFVLVMIEELSQVMPLISHTQVPFGLAHGGVTPENSRKLPESLHKSDPKALVEKFNAGTLPVLIGTSCIGTGTNIHPPGPMVILYLAGGRSEIQFRQYVGRGTRIEGKKDFIFVDFDVSNIDVLHRHANDRRVFAEELFETPKEMIL